MNFLAHVYLSCQNNDLLVGNFLADFLTTKEYHLQPKDVKLGIELHKSIDKYTDQHPDVKACVAILRTTQGKYSPVIMDILFDFFLIKNWQKFSNQKLHTFTSNVYVILNDNIYLFPSKLQNALPFMIADDFLLSCKDEERLIKTFERLKKRVRFENHFDSILIDLNNHYEKFDKHFLRFFPDLIKHVNTFCNC